MLNTATLKIIDEDLNVYTIGKTPSANVQDIVNRKLEKDFSIKLDKDLCYTAIDGNKFYIKKLKWFNLKTRYAIKKTIRGARKVYCFPLMQSVPEAAITTKKIITDQTYLMLSQTSHTVYMAFRSYDNTPDGNTVESYKYFPFGNCYNDGKICMGNDFRAQETCLETLNHAIELINTSEWQEDLLKSEMVRFCEKYLRFGLDQESIKIDDLLQNWRGMIPKSSIHITALDQAIKKGHII